MQKSDSYYSCPLSDLSSEACGFCPETKHHICRLTAAAVLLPVEQKFRQRQVNTCEVQGRDNAYSVHPTVVGGF